MPLTRDYVAQAELDQAHIKVAISPVPTMFVLTRDALQHGRRGTPATWRRAVVAHLRGRHAAALAPLTDRRTTGWPSPLDDVGATRESIDDALQRLAATSTQVLMDALDGDRDVTPSPAWDLVRRDPDSWLRAYVDAMQHAWHGLAPLWRRSVGHLEREAERLNAAIELGVPKSQIVNAVMPRADLVDHALLVGPSAQPRRLKIDRDGVILSPMIAASGTGTISSPGECIVRLAYPVREAWQAVDDTALPFASLEALVGSPRATVLRRLGPALSAGALAETCGLAAATLTYHLRALEAAGLVVRQRRGRNVIVSRTPRGTRLLGLYPGHS